MSLSTTIAAPVAVVGAGIAGLACAHRLAGAGVPVQVLDKGRGPGGRLATRRAEDGALTFDHGAQYATARDPAFQTALEAAAEAGTAAPWDGRWAMLGEDGFTRVSASETRWIGRPGMSGLVKALAADVSVTQGIRITALDRDDAGLWRLTDADGRTHGPYHAVALTVPAPQAREMLGGRQAAFPALARVRYAPCWAAMAAWDASLPLPFDMARLEDPVLGLAARNGAKPGRAPEADCWTLHGAPDWSRDHLEDDAGTAARRLLDRFVALTGVTEAVRHLSAHRWRYALVERPADVPYLLDAVAGLGLAGDWCRGPRVELAFLSGRDLAGALLESLAVAA
ncbi:NAD(P)/FAD-dependent oxidoreductase [Caenispirillum salinarum]|uniref:NAD(P)/FAD-dependent oxidoreductase n=1 Tax=Caenispirillum salinarum TaxID=859058 RepID=UPI00384B54B3